MNVPTIPDIMLKDVVGLAVDDVIVVVVVVFFVGGSGVLCNDSRTRMLVNICNEQ